MSLSKQEEELSFEEKLEKALKLYDVVINAHSLQDIKDGWKIYGSKERRYGKHHGRVVALVGSFKVGKTWLASKLLGVDLQHDPTIPTLGVSMKLPKLSPNAQSSESAPLPEKKPSIAIGGKKKSNNAPAPAKKIESMIVLDTAGTDRPAADSLLRDSMSLEYFLRELIIEIAEERVILVITKFDRPSQEYIQRLINQLDTKQKTSIGPSKRLVVVHNYRDVLSDDVLARRINEVKDSYDSSEWMEIPFETIFFYNTPKITHIFLANDSEQAWGNKITDDISFQAASGSAYNTMALKKLQAIIGNDNVKTIDLIDEILKRSTANLERYLKNWEGFGLELRKNDNNNDGEDALVPVVLPKESDDVTPFQEYLKSEGPWKLADITFTNKGIISESVFTLEGEVKFPDVKTTGPRDIIVNINAPGFTDEKKNSKYIKININDNKTIKIELKIDPPGKSLYSTIRFGKGNWVYTLPDSIRYELPKSLVELYQNHLSIANGVITLKLKEQLILTPVEDNEESEEE